MTDEQKKLLKNWDAYEEDGGEIIPIYDTYIDNGMTNDMMHIGSVRKLLEAQKAQTQDEERKRAADMLITYWPNSFADDTEALFARAKQKILNPESNDYNT